MMKHRPFCWCRKSNYKMSVIFIDGVAHYGIEVICGGERKVIADISTNKAEVKKLCHRVCRGKVSPLALQDVVEDWLER